MLQIFALGTSQKTALTGRGSVLSKISRVPGTLWPCSDWLDHLQLWPDQWPSAMQINSPVTLASWHQHGLAWHQQHCVS